MVGIAISFLVIGIFTVFMSGYESSERPNAGWPLLTIIGVLLFMIGSFIIYDLGKGNLDTRDNLETNAIYETRSSVFVNGKYAVILQKQNGDLVAYSLDQNPPSVFKKTNDPKNPYQPYPR